MNRIDKLIIQAKRMARPGLELTAALNKTTWPTIEAAVEHIHAMSLEYPNSKDVPIIIDDLGG